MLPLPRRRLLTGTLVTAALEATALRPVCAVPPPAAAAKSPPPGTQPPARLTLVLDWLLNSNHAAIFAAQHLGAFARAGLAVDIIAPSDPDLPVRLLAAGHTDLALGYGSQINLLVDKGLPLTRVATLIGSPLNTVAAPDSSAIRSLADLRGKTIGFNVAGVEDAMLDTMLRSAAVPPASVTRVKLTYDLVSALLTRRLDAAIGAYRNVEVLALRAAGLTPAVFLPEDHGVPLYDEIVVLARRDAISDPRLSAFIGALREATPPLLAAPEELWRAFITAHPELDTPVNALSWTATLPLLARDPARLDGPRYLRFQDFLFAAGVISKKMPLDTFAVALER